MVDYKTYVNNIFEDHKPDLLDRTNGNKDFHNNGLKLTFKTNELSIIRKAWELGTQEIAMQTVIQLDGDVVTRIQPEFMRGINKDLFDIHNQGVATSIKYWKTLVSLIQDFIKTIWKLMLPI